MPITDAQKAAAEQQQWNAAKDAAQQIRLVAGPGTGKSRTIEKRIDWILSNNIDPAKVFVISFTRATCLELRNRIAKFCNGKPYEDACKKLNVSTMHSLALKILRRGNLLSHYPSGTPIMLDDWEQVRIYDQELSHILGCTPTRAAQIRLAYDAAWQTLDPSSMDQAKITPAEQTGFNSFHAARTNLYSCVLPGEVIFKCVEAIKQGSLQEAQLPQIHHLIVDEYQDLNACDQEFVRILCVRGAVLFVAGDDDQSIYSFRHANPEGIVNFKKDFPNASDHELTDCFRCTPAVLEAAIRLIQVNPIRLGKNLVALYGAANPPVPGSVAVWAFANADSEAKAIAESCQVLISAGMAGREDEIVILLSARKPKVVFLDALAKHLEELKIPFSPPQGADLTELDAIRAVYAMLRITRDKEKGEPDYPAHRDLLSLLSGVGVKTVIGLADLCIQKQQNFHDLIYQQPSPPWLQGRTLTALKRLSGAAVAATSWKMDEALGARKADIKNALAGHIFTTGNQIQSNLEIWDTLTAALPDGMTLGELLELLSAGTESEQTTILNLVKERLGIQPNNAAIPKKIRILTMHGAKGLSGRIVFIPFAEQNIIPSRRNLRATGLLIEHRRLFYVSVTRAMAVCIFTHARVRTGAAAQALVQAFRVQFPRSQFLDEMKLPSQTRNSGLSAAEAAAIVAQVNAL